MINKELEETLENITKNIFIFIVVVLFMIAVKNLLHSL